MGCPCSKASAIEDSRESPREKVEAKLRAVTHTIAVPSEGEEEAVPEKGIDIDYGKKKGNAEGLQKQGHRSTRVNSTERPKEKRLVAQLHHPIPTTGSIPRSREGEGVAAGWPAWLVAVAGEAINGWVPRRADSFEKLDKIGQGTYSNVYRARDLENGKIVALKKVRFDNLEPESVRFMAREIHILRRLHHPNVIKLEGLVTSRMSCSLYLVFEYMEHDLAGLVSNPTFKFAESQVKCYMQQLLCGLDHCHSRNILHRDIKGSNLLIDNHGTLKIADFGLASFFDPEKKHHLTSRVVTLWYRPPELLLGATDYGVAVDLWSAGCILAELYAGKPIMPGRTEVEQLHKIFKLCGSPSEEYWRKSRLPNATIFKPQHPYRRCVQETFSDFPSPALSLMDVLLSIDPADRGTATLALQSEFFATSPLPCDPSSLPKYPPSKEFDAKLRVEDAKRNMGGEKMHRLNHDNRESRDSKALPVPHANAELPVSLQRRKGQLSAKSQSEKFNSQHEEIASGFPIDPPRQGTAVSVVRDMSQGYACSRASHSGPLSQWRKASKHGDDVYRSSSGRNFPLEPASATVAASCSVSEKAWLSQAEGGRCQALENEGSYSIGSDVGNGCQEDDRICHDASMLGDGSKGSNIHYSGPLIRTSGNVEQVLKEHDRQIQAAVRRARRDRARLRKLHVEGSKFSAKQCSGVPLFSGH